MVAVIGILAGQRLHLQVKALPILRLRSHGVVQTGSCHLPGRNVKHQAGPVDLAGHLLAIGTQPEVIGEGLPLQLAFLRGGRHHPACRNQEAPIHIAHQPGHDAQLWRLHLIQALAFLIGQTFHMVKPRLDHGSCQATIHKGPMTDVLHQVDLQGRTRCSLHLGRDDFLHLGRDDIGHHLAGRHLV